MSASPADRVARFVNDLLHGRRPARFQASAEEVEAMMAAATLAAGRAGADVPDAEALERIHQRLTHALDEGATTRSGMTRRTWLQTAGAAAAALVAGVAIDEIVGRQIGSQPADTGQAELKPAGGSWRPVASLEQVPPGHAMPVSTGSVDAVVVNDSGVVTAVSGICTHLGCRLQPDPATRQLNCPCHQTAFSWSGRVLYYRLQKAPATLPRIPARVTDGQIELFAV